MIFARHPDVPAAAQALAKQVIAALQQGLDRRGHASLVVAGGRTPVPMYRALRGAPLDWARVAVTLTDERWVPGNDAASNARLLQAELLQERAAAARFLPLYDGTGTASDAVDRVWQSLQELSRPFDAVVLGMGDDGHFASLFPGNPGLAHALDPQARPGCVAMLAPAAPAQRISLNLAALRETHRLFLLCGGEAKQAVLLQAAGEGGARRWPVAALLALRQPEPEVYWAPDGPAPQ